MVDVKGNNDSDAFVPIESTVLSPVKASMDVIVSASESENKVDRINEEVGNEERKIIASKENPVEEDSTEYAVVENKESKGEDPMEEENGEDSVEEEEEEEDSDHSEENNNEEGDHDGENNNEEENHNEDNNKVEMDEDKYKEGATEKEEMNDVNALVEENAENNKNEENNKEKVGANSNEKNRRPRKRNRGKKVTQGATKRNEVNATMKEKDAMVEGKAENNKSEGKNKEKVDANSNENTRKPRKRNRSKKVTQGANDNVVGNDEDKPESSGKKKASGRVESMGMIFMCSSKTKTDCYRYNVLGLPASKKDIVQKVYKGMRLFLFDVDLKLMYGIYKAVGPGGSNIEPKAFKSAFPSQVRFKVLEDCLPLAEEEFKKVIKDNYFSRNKFDCQLNSEQVKKLCKLFVSSSKVSKPQKVVKSVVPEKHVPGDRGRRRRPGQDEKRGSQLRRKRHLSGDQGRQIQRGRHEEMGSSLGRERRHDERAVLYTTETFPSQVVTLPRVQQLPAPAPAPMYAYERPLVMDAYSQRERLLEHRGLQLIDLEPRHLVEGRTIDPYPSFREREAPPYRNPVYSAGSQREYYPPAALPAEYRPLGRESDYRHVGRESDYRQVGRESDYRHAGQESDYRHVGQKSDYRHVGRESDYHTTRDLATGYLPSAGLPSEYRHSSSSLLAEYRAAGIPTEDRVPAGASREYRLVGPSTEYHNSSGALRDNRSHSHRTGRHY